MTTFGVERASPRLTAALKRRMVSRAIDFLAEREGLSTEQRAALEAVPIRWRRRQGGSRFYSGPAHGYHGPHILLSVGRGSVQRWHTYRRVRAGLTTPRQGIPMATELHATVVLVHEFTHALQHGVCGTPRRRFSEVETTDHEIEFVRRVAPELHAQLVPVTRKAPNTGSSRRRRASTRALRKVSRVPGMFDWLRDLLGLPPR